MIVVVGDLAVDIVSHLRAPLAHGSDAAAQIQVAPGGSGANVAVWLARLGCPVTCIGRIGDDTFGRWLRDDLEAEGVRAALVTDPQRHTAVIQVLVEPDGERTMVADRGANACWAEGDVPEQIIAAADLLHVVGYVLLDRESRTGALQAMRYARSHGIPISLDPSSHAPLLASGVEEFWSLVGRVSVLLPNRHEARALTGSEEVEEQLARLLERADVVAIKLDREGCIAGAGDARWRVRAPEAVIVNSTGAGDAFNAAFLARWVQDRDVAAACRAAVALGTHAATLPTTR